MKNTAIGRAEPDTLSAMAPARRLGPLGCCLLFALAAPSCKCGGGDAIADAGSSDTGASVSLFSGAPGADVKLTRLVNVGAHGVFLSLPEGWGGDEDHIAGLVTVSPNDQSAVATVYLVKGAVTDATIALWTKSSRGTDVSYGPAQPGKIGKTGLDGEMANGMGQLAGKDAEFWRFAVPLDADTNMLVIAAVQKSAELRRRAELIACLRSLYKS